MGLGYIGLPTAIIAAKHGVQVTGVDINPKVVEMTNQGHLHIVEPGMEEMLQDVVRSGALHASTTPEVSDAYFMVVPTPFKGNHEPDISYVEAATRAVIPFLKEGDLYVIESTSPVGTTDKMAKLIFELRPELRGKIHIAYCPERVLPGNVIYELVHNDRVIGGMDEASTDKAIAFYSQFVQGTLHRTNCKTAEMCKLTENSSRDVQIAFANELSLICDKAGINVWELIALANKHPRVNILQPGCGVGGHCIAVDPYFLTADFPVESHLIAKAREINNYKAYYYEALRQSSAGWETNENSYFPFIENFLSTLYMCYKELDKRFAVVHGKKITKKARVEATVLNSLTPLSKAEICKILPDVSPTTVEAVLGAMVKTGSVKRIGSGRATRYIKV